jgi:hypothetical protein
MEKTENLGGDCKKDYLAIMIKAASSATGHTACDAVSVILARPQPDGTVHL